MSKSLVVIITVILTLILLSPVIYAEDEVPQDIRRQVEADFEKYKGALNADRENYGLSEQDTAVGSVLGEGYAYYVVSKAFLDDKSAEMFSFAGYIFPIIAGSKSAGIVIAEQQEGIWKVSSISSDLTLEQDIKEGRTNFKDPSRSFLVCDESFRLTALTDGKDSLVSIKDRIYSDLKKNEVHSLKEIGIQIKSEYEINKLQNRNGGLIIEERESNSLLVWILIGSIAAAGLAYIAFRLYKEK
ncbi:hypothetical protein [Paenibacillus sp. sgz500958]|uniref:hypothetical protein n=1 Tax=Paenibacillus sp. sgz500958 TaxID=3242475 RepID=UPI0036D32596